MNLEKEQRIIRQFKHDRYASSKWLAYLYNADIQEVETLLANHSTTRTFSPEQLRDINER